MKYLLVNLLFLLTFFADCSGECRSAEDTTKKFTFMSRDGVGGADKINAYADNLLVDKSTAQKLSIYDYVTLARQYLDTVHADISVYAVTFYGVNLCDPEIYPASNNVLDYAVIRISFDYDSAGLIRSGEKTNLYSIWLWKEGQDYKKGFYDDRMFTFNEGKMTIINRDKNTGRTLLNSLENSHVPLREIWITVDTLTALQLSSP